ncbi:uncharacterized protein NEMAJ01_2197 [Nematocida major]|uniref:uncharacterized protein n=1 Tax=Nematocida major TaxID=1912982 RepID=UPI002008C06E|nr:uncharacterized protein NEMAJ01_2197 [Nematocida major]KAH9387301.1 hypothetical protein NEMAJ01_2197 [Nematocida major]
MTSRPSDYGLSFPIYAEILQTDSFVECMMNNHFQVVVFAAVFGVISLAYCAFLLLQTRADASRSEEDEEEAKMRGRLIRAILAEKQEEEESGISPEKNRAAGEPEDATEMQVLFEGSNPQEKHVSPTFTEGEIEEIVRESRSLYTVEFPIYTSLASITPVQRLMINQVGCFSLTMLFFLVGYYFLPVFLHMEQVYTEKSLNSFIDDSPLETAYTNFTQLKIAVERKIPEVNGVPATKEALEKAETWFSVLKDICVSSKCVQYLQVFDIDSLEECSYRDPAKAEKFLGVFEEALRITADSVEKAKKHLGEDDVKTLLKTLKSNFIPVYGIAASDQTVDGITHILAHSVAALMERDLSKVRPELSSEFQSVLIDSLSIVLEKADETFCGMLDAVVNGESPERVLALKEKCVRTLSLLRGLKEGAFHGFASGPQIALMDSVAANLESQKVATEALVKFVDGFLGISMQDSSWEKSLNVEFLKSVHKQIIKTSGDPPLSAHFWETIEGLVKDPNFSYPKEFLREISMTIKDSWLHGNTNGKYLEYVAAFCINRGNLRPPFQARVEDARKNLKMIIELGRDISTPSLVKQLTDAFDTMAKHKNTGKDAEKTVLFLKELVHFLFLYTPEQEERNRAELSRMLWQLVKSRVDAFASTDSTS